MNEINKAIITDYTRQIAEIDHEILTYLKSLGRETKTAIEAYCKDSSDISKYHAVNDVIKISLRITERAHDMIKKQEELSVIESTLRNENDD